MFKKILIANRGEIACRVAATARRLGIRTVAVHSDADAQAQHVLACDEAVHIGGSAPKESYLLADRILAVAKATGAEAVHPGYGFLSENDDFAERCEAAGIAFIGPRPHAIRAMGLKAESKALMEKAGVPLVPGYHGQDQDPALLKREAERIGFPVLIKASAGGGGKGMRAVHSSEEFDAALASCKREAINSFGDDAVLVERYVQRPRHIEIQVFADEQGDCVYLFERDCSVQRRHQKVLEEAPAPGMTESMRREMGEAAVAAAKAVNYRGAGTVEFIVEQRDDGSMRFYFMEMNTRLQVEHPVTEAITGLDLVEWQLRVAAGQPLPLKQEALRIHGHAIEARICAENPDRDFLPATGSLDVLRWPAHVRFERAAGHPAVRVDAGVVQGDAISPFYDSMVAKLIVWGEDRAQALARLDQALAETRIVGLPTNVAFLRRVLATESFAKPVLDTALIQREKAQLFGVPALPLSWQAAAVAARLVAQERARQAADPWSRVDGWRIHGVAQRRLDLLVGDERVDARLNYLHDGGFELLVGGQTLGLQFRELSADRLEIQLSGDGLGQGGHGQSERRVMDVFARGERFAVFSAQGSAELQLIDPLAHAGDAAQEGGRLTAPMPGKVIAFLVQPGATVEKGQPLAVMEAMKMEHTIAAPKAGVVSELLFAVGDQVSEGQELLRLQAAG